MAASPLDAIVAGASQEAPDLPRLTAANVFIHHARLGAAIARIADAYKLLPDATQQGFTDELKELIKNCESASKLATRLLEANR